MKNGREERMNFIYISWQNKQKNKTNEIEYKMILVLLRGKFAAFFSALEAKRGIFCELNVSEIYFSIIYSKNSAARSRSKQFLWNSVGW